MTSIPGLTVAFRVDASFDIGTGHVMRCLTLADALVAGGARCLFICREHPGNLIGYIRDRGYPAHELPPPETSTETKALGHCSGGPPHARWLGCHWETDAEQTSLILNKHRPDWLVVDHYALDARWERALQGAFGKMMVVDDLADRPHICDLLLDQNLGRKPDDYSDLVPEYCERLIGPRFALLRPEFAALREYSLQRRRRPELKRLLVTMGGVDQPNATGRVLDALSETNLPGDVEITVVMGASAPWLEEVRRRARRMPFTTEVVVNITDMARRMADADLAIGAAGSTAWERCCLGVPAIMVILAENQRAIANALVASGSAILLDQNAIVDQLVRILNKLVGPDERLQSLAENARTICDGRGTPRLVSEMVRISKL